MRRQFLFELPDLGADGRLRAVTRLRGLRKAFEANNFQKRVELIEIHGYTPTCRPDRDNVVLIVARRGGAATWLPTYRV